MIIPNKSGYNKVSVENAASILFPLLCRLLLYAVKEC